MVDFQDIKKAVNIHVLRALGFDLNAYITIEAQPLALPWVASRELVYSSEVTKVPPTISGYGYNHVSPSRHSYTVIDSVTTGRQGYLISHMKVLAESASWTAQDCIVELGYARKSSPKAKLCSNAIVMPQNSYYHWLMEDVPAFLRAREIAPEAVVVTHARPPVYVSDFLRTYESGPVHYFDGAIRLESATFVSKKGISGVPQAGDIDILDKKLSLNPQNCVNPLVYVSRRGSMRSLDNEAILERELEKLGFLVVKSQDLSFSEQIRLFSGAIGVIGVHGAGLTNVAFMNSGFVIEILSPGWPNPCFEILSRKKGLLFNRVLSSAELNTVDIPEVISVAERLISQVSRGTL